MSVHQTLADRAGDGGTHESSDQIKYRRQRNRLAWRQYFGRNDRGDGICGIMKAVDVLKSQCRQENDKKDSHGLGRDQRSGLGIF